MLFDDLRSRMGEWTVSELMSTAVKTIDVNSTLREAIHKMREYRVHCLVVTRDKKPLGVVSTYDVLLSITKKEHTGDVKVGDVMSSELVTAAPHEDAFTALERIMEHHIGRLIVLDDDKLLGVVSSTDLIDAFDKSSGLKNHNSLSELKSRFRVRDIKELMHEISTIDADALVCDAAKKMDEKDIGSLLVTEENEITGIITERDIFRKTVAVGEDCESIRVKSIMTRGFYTLELDDSILEASRLFNKHRIRRLPVVKDGGIVGVISARDVAKVIYNKRLI